MKDKEKDIDYFYNQLAEKVADDLENGSLDAKERAKLFVAILPYKFPKLQQIENKGGAFQITIFGDVGDKD